MWKNTDFNQYKINDSIYKDQNLMISNFDAAKKLFQNNSYRNRLDLFFIDHEFIPLLIQENYLNAFQDRNS